MVGSRWPWRGADRPSFDALLERLGSSPTSLSESELLKETHWALGQDARLREDARFRETPWQRWIRADDLIANEALYRELRGDCRGSVGLSAALAELGRRQGRRCVLCPADPRLVLAGGELRLAASELSLQPVIEEEVGELEKYTTHLPLHSLKAAAASAPSGEWGAGAQEQLIETLGWVRVSNRHRLNARMFVAQVEGHSMDDGRSGLVDGGYAIFELWPAGTKQQLNVLVRGAFRDPETGSYAVKKYMSDQRDEEGRHRQITLVSLNPDKDRYPDITLQVEDDESLAVVAKVIQALSPDEYARRPKPLRRVGRRELETMEAIEGVYAHLAARATRFFDAEEVVGGDEAPVPASWNRQLVCLDIGAGGLHVEIGPLVNLWRFVKTLTLCGASGEQGRVLASNARLRPTRVPVRPSLGPWSWVADGFEDELDVDLSTLEMVALPQDRVVAFRVGADDVGRLLRAEQLSPGQVYRLLVPPEVWEVEDAMPASALADGWRLVEVALPVEPAPELVHALGRLGLRVGEPAPVLSFGLASWPDAWCFTPRWEAFAAFAASGEGVGEVLVAVDGYDAEVDGEAQLFVDGPGGPRRVALPAGASAVVALSGLAVGRYFCTLLHQRTRVQPAHLPFVVSADLSAPPRASWGAMIASNACYGAPNEERRIWHGDLTGLQAETFAVEGPPGWGVRALWRELSAEYLATVELDRAGQLDIPALFRLTQGRHERRQLGDLVLDFAEFGALVLEHEQQVTVEGVADTLRELVRVKGDFVRRRGGAYAQLLPVWFEPLLRCLGYEVGPIEELVVEPPSHAAVAGLLVMERRADGIKRRYKRVFVMLEALSPRLDDEFLRWIDDVCLRFDVERALLSAGMTWADHRRRRRLPLKIWALEAVLEEKDLLIEFLRDVAEGV